MKKNDFLKIDKKKFNSRLIVGTGKYKNMSECAKAIKISGAEIVTVIVELSSTIVVLEIAAITFNFTVLLDWSVLASFPVPS